MKHSSLRAAACLTLLAFLAGCGASGAAKRPAQSDAYAWTPGATAAVSACSKSSASESTVPAASAPAAAAGFAFAAFQDSTFTAPRAVQQNEVSADLSSLAQGYAGISAVCASRLKFQVVCGDVVYNYDLPGDGTPTIYPLQSGSGSYKLRVMKNIQDQQYVELWSEKVDVQLADEFQPYLRPSQLVSYSADSACVAKARQLAQGCASDADYVSAVYDYLTQNVVYDYDKANSVQSGYLPDPDETLSTGKGICFDYAALAAAMLRSGGVPTKLIMGYVGGTIYHAWNEIYLQDQGWVKVEIRLSAQQWQRIDTTFAATGADTAFLTDDANYVKQKTY